MRLRTTIRGGLVAVSSAALVLSGALAQNASADPLDDAKAKLAKIEQRQSELGEDWSQAKLEFDRGKQKVARLNSDLDAQRARVKALSGQAQQAALARYQNRGVDITLQLITSPDPESFLSDLGTISRFDQNMNSLMQDYQAQQANLADLRRVAADQVKTLAAEEKKLSDLRAELDQQAAESKRLIAQLTEQQRQRLNAELEDDRADAADADSRSSNSARTTLPADSGNANARALKAVRYAVSKVPNSQYVTGAEGPNAFDCSGLLLAAYKTVGVSLPHSSRAMFSVGRPVSLKELKPGDLIFFYSPISHVAMYMGGGKIVHARNPRVDLDISGLYSYGAPITGARRVIG